MLFFMKPSVIHLDCFTNRPDVYEYFKVEHSHKFLPEWWKKLPSTLDNNNVPYIEPTIKNCIGFNQFYNKGITIPFWSDFSFLKLENGPYKFEFSDKRTEVLQHSFHQMEGYLNSNDYAHLKIISPWLFSTKQDIKWSWVANTWALDDLTNITIPPAIVDYKYNNFTYINMFVNISNLRKNKFLIQSKTPLVNIIPLSDNKVKIHNHYDPDKFFLISEKGNRFSYTNLYNKRKKIVKEKKCPFGF